MIVLPDPHVIELPEADLVLKVSPGAIVDRMRAVCQQHIQRVSLDLAQLTAPDTGIRCRIPWNHILFPKNEKREIFTPEECVRALQAQGLLEQVRIDVRTLLEECRDGIETCAVLADVTRDDEQPSTVLLRNMSGEWTLLPHSREPQSIRGIFASARQGRIVQMSGVDGSDTAIRCWHDGSAYLFRRPQAESRAAKS